MTYVCNTISENTGCYVEFSPFYFIFNYLFLIVTINFDVEIALFIVQSNTLNLSLKCKIFVMLLRKQNGDITYLPLQNNISTITNLDMAYVYHLINKLIYNFSICISFKVQTLNFFINYIILKDKDEL